MRRLLFLMIFTACAPSSQTTANKNDNIEVMKNLQVSFTEDREPIIGYKFNTKSLSAQEADLRYNYSGETRSVDLSGADFKKLK